MYKRWYLRSQFPYDARRRRLLAFMLLGLSLTLLSYNALVPAEGPEFQSYISRPVYRDKELVFAATSYSDMNWVAEELGSWWANIYRSDDVEAQLTVPANKGNEAMVYLTLVCQLDLFVRLC